MLMLCCLEQMQCLRLPLLLTKSFVWFVFLQSKEEVMAVRLREADNIAAMAELQQQISELEIEVKSQHTHTHTHGL